MKQSLGISVLGLAIALAAVNCSPEEKKPAAATKPMAEASLGEGSTSVAITEGEAGGVIETTFTASATVAAIDGSTRNVTLQTADGNKATFKAPPEMRNFAQLQVGDKVTATIAERLAVFVDRSGAAPSAVHTADIATAPKGAKPGAIVAEAYQLVATVKSIDTGKRTAVLSFADGDTRTVHVRPDVDLGRYKVGNSVVIRATETLMIVAEQP